MMLAASIKEMIAKLTQDGMDEVKLRDYCIEELHQTGIHSDDTYHTKANPDTKHAHLESAIKRLTSEIEVALASKAEMQIEMKLAEAREKVSREYVASLPISCLPCLCIQPCTENKSAAVEKSQIFSAYQDNQPTVNIQVLVGERPTTKGNQPC